ncbi:diacylglycerol kinase family protein [Radiobacillus kanasensis]|uniref:diacylglycerol kinase family protein n=1 Tax=Radiobacillus kanasensis TaxID=2844358 RepID=UPI001E3AD53A|nr:diacylglycerol kinase family protein [Radiobacillus kanasensis]UFT97813.1 diacylglycerol kinase family protein [Radiobacillus kanasensis]
MFAWNGIRTVFRTERNFKVHIFLGISVILLGILFRIERIEWIAVSITIALVLSLEMFNTAIEKIMDYQSSDMDPRIGEIKDIAAGAVLMSAIMAAIVGGFIFIPKIINFIW